MLVASFSTTRINIFYLSLLPSNFLRHPLVKVYKSIYGLYFLTIKGELACKNEKREQHTRSVR